MRSIARTVIALLVALSVVLPALASALPVDGERDPLLSRPIDGGTANAGGEGQPWPVVEADGVPASDRPWMVRVHEDGRPYPPQLLEELAPRGADDVVPAIVQFREGTDADDLALLSRLGLQLVHRWVGVDACHVRGPVGAIWALLDSGRTWYVEPVEPIVHDMEVGTRVINATRVWASEVQQRMASAGRIDGRGVTCVVVDTGIDASHPDLDYGTKTIFNLRSDTGDGPYYSVENSDLGYGHGTHVAGTVAGNGDASAGARRGVAPGGNLIGITVDTDNSAGYIGALDWVWQNSRPGNNPHNIRLLTNSWHSTVEEYDPQKALIVLINAIAFENNVVSTWSAGNDGRDDPEGNELTTSGQGNTPVGIMCAAYERDGSGVAEFSSRGKRGDTHTYPDVGAPGVQIWSCSARRTIISGGAIVGGNDNPYYLAISGTSMSTPHVAGLVTLLWQAAPSLTVSGMHEDHSGEPGDWFDRDDTRIHEIEWIIESTATFLPGEGLAVNGIPAHEGASDGYGHENMPIDYVQGYGIVNAERAVAVALTLEQLRMDNPGLAVTVEDALRAYEASMEEGEREVRTDVLTAGWNGEWGRWNDQTTGAKPSSNQTKLVWVPEGVESVDIVMTYATVDTVELSSASITYTVDFGADGSVDVTGDMFPALNGVRTGTVSASGHEDDHWAVSVYGQGFKLQRPLQDRNYIEVRVEYSTSLVAHLSSGGGALLVEPPDLGSGYYHAYSQPWSSGAPGPDYTGGTVVLPHLAYNLTRVELIGLGDGPGDGQEEGSGGVPWWLLVAVLVVAAVVYYRYRDRLPGGRHVGRLVGRARAVAGRVTRRPMG